MRVDVTNLAMRFYKRQGWKEETLRGLVVKFLHHEPFKYFDDVDAYWVPDVGTRLDMDKLMTLVTEVHQAFPDHPSWTDRQVLESKNW
jgi:hypothetical protein